MFKVKIVMVGPCQSGKTMIANFVSDATESVGGEYRSGRNQINHSYFLLIMPIFSKYRPTAGARILEFEMPSINVNNKVGGDRYIYILSIYNIVFCQQE